MRPSFWTRGNPLSSDVNHTIFASHNLIRRGKVNNILLDIEDAKVKIEAAVRDFKRTQPSKVRDRLNDC